MLLPAELRYVDRSDWQGGQECVIGPDEVRALGETDAESRCSIESGAKRSRGRLFGVGQTTDLGVRGSTPLGRAILSRGYGTIPACPEAALRPADPRRARVEQFRPAPERRCEGPAYGYS